ncbi:MAG: hypothetical protein R3A12_04565 [Ignavibacteria bacterium]
MLYEDPKTIRKILKFSSSGDSLSSGDFNNTGYGRITSLSLDINGDPCRMPGQFSEA